VALRAKVAKKSYTSPSFKVLDAAAAQAELKAKGVPDDRVTQEMLSLLQEMLSLTDELLQKKEAQASLINGD